MTTVRFRLDVIPPRLVCSSYDRHTFTDNLNMFGAFKADRLKVNLRLVINRLKLLEKKKSKAFSEITFSYFPLVPCLFVRCVYNFCV